MTAYDKISELQNQITMMQIFMVQRELMGEFTEWINEMTAGTAGKPTDGH